MVVDLITQVFIFICGTGAFCSFGRGVLDEQGGEVGGEGGE